MIRRRCNQCGKLSNAKDGEYQRADGSAGYINQEQGEAAPVCTDCREASSGHWVKVECRFVIDVEVENLSIEQLPFYIEEHCCPATGHVGAALTSHIKEHEANSTCWACALQAENRIVEIDGKQVEPGDSSGQEFAALFLAGAGEILHRFEITPNYWHVCWIVGGQYKAGYFLFENGKFIQETAETWNVIR